MDYQVDKITCFIKENVHCDLILIKQHTYGIMYSCMAFFVKQREIFLKCPA